MAYDINVNGVIRTADVDGDTPLLRVLRDVLGPARSLPLPKGEAEAADAAPSCTLGVAALALLLGVHRSCGQGVASAQ